MSSAGTTTPRKLETLEDFPIACRFSSRWLSVYAEEGDGVGEAQSASEEEWRRQEEVEYEVRADGDANQESDMAVSEIAVDSSPEIPRVDIVRFLFHA